MLKSTFQSPITPLIPTAKDLSLMLELISGKKPLILAGVYALDW